MAKIHELLDSLNEENASELKEQIKAEADALHQSNKHLYSRAKKAEGFEKNEKGEWIKKVELKKGESKPQTKKSDEPDYTKEMVEDTFMESKGYKLDEQKEFLKKEAQHSGKPLKDLLKFKYVQEELKNLLDQSEAQSGLPKGKGKGGGTGKNSVDYHLAKGTTPENVDEANEVINARMKKETESKMFSEQLYNE